MSRRDSRIEVRPKVILRPGQLPPMGPRQDPVIVGDLILERAAVDAAGNALDRVTGIGADMNVADVDEAAAAAVVAYLQTASLWREHARLRGALMTVCAACEDECDCAGCRALDSLGTDKQ